MSNITKQIINIHIFNQNQPLPSTPPTGTPSTPSTGFLNTLTDFAQTNLLTTILLTLGIAAIILAIIFFIKHKKNNNNTKLSPSFKTSKFSLKNKLSDRISKPKTKFATIFVSFSTAIFAAVFMFSAFANAVAPHTDITSNGSDIDITLVKGEGSKTTVAKNKVNITSNINTELTAKLSLDMSETSPEFIANFAANTGNISAPAPQTANTLVGELKKAGFNVIDTDGSVGSSYYANVEINGYAGYVSAGAISEECSIDFSKSLGRDMSGYAHDKNELYEAADNIKKYTAQK